MVEPYNHLEIEPKWQSKWKEDAVFATPEPKSKEDATYILDMFPFPSGSGLHVGHLLGYTGSDVIARTARMQGKSVLHPMGWDAFGLPAENFALKTGIHPAVSTENNTQEYKRQFNQAGISFDWSKELNTSHPDYYKWTQWFFVFLYERGLAYRKDGLVNWCPNDQTVLANEQVVSGLCDRCGTKVVQKNLTQWYFKITDYSERLLEGLDTIDWPEKIKTMQRNWIGKSSGARIAFQIENTGKSIDVYTTRVDTIFGATYLVLAPEHPLVAEITTPGQSAAVTSYQAASTLKTELEREHLDKQKTGVFTGAYSINPANQERIPVWIADYVLIGYGTGAIMAVPAHDERDKEFAQAFNLPIVEVVNEAGKLVNSEEFTDLPFEVAKQAIGNKIQATFETRYRLRDWLVSRQRYWGAPIPVMYDENGKEVLIKTDELPVTLPTNVTFSPTGESPLLSAPDWLNVEIDGKHFRREADTLDGFVCSSWYFLRYPNPNYTEGPFDPEAVKKWLPVTMYIGGAEHAVLHLLYARFFTKVLFDAGYIDFDEPFLKLRNQGNILAEDHSKMSKSKPEGVVNPDVVITELGADTLRTYEMFMAPFETEKPWDTKGIIGVRRFLEKVWRLQERVKEGGQSPEEKRIIHRAIKKVTDDIAATSFNTAVAFLMETVNALQALPHISQTTLSELVRILSPFAPHIAEEMWSQIGEGYCAFAEWPTYNPDYLTQDTATYAIQINGKVRGKIEVPVSATSEEIQARVKEDIPQVAALYQESPSIRVIFVPGRLISYVTPGS